MTGDGWKKASIIALAERLYERSVESHEMTDPRCLARTAIARSRAFYEVVEDEFREKKE